MSTIANNENYALTLEDLRHPWQPDWILTKDDVQVFLKLMDYYKYLVEDEKDWYPPYLVFIESFNEKQMIGTIKSKWFMKYDPFLAGKDNPIYILRINGVKV